MICPICGADHASCGGGVGVVRAIDQAITVVEVRSVGDLKHYTDPEGHVFSMTEERAKLFGYTLAPEQQQPKKATAMPAREAQPAEGTEAQPGEGQTTAARAQRSSAPAGSPTAPAGEARAVPRQAEGKDKG